MPPPDGAEVLVLVSLSCMGVSKNHGALVQGLLFQQTHKEDPRFTEPPACISQNLGPGPPRHLDLDLLNLKPSA